MSRVITDPFHSILTTTSLRISRVVLILLSMSLSLSGKTFGAAIGVEALESDGKDYSSIPADQTVDWLWSTSASSFDGNLNLLNTDLYDKGEWQNIRGAEENLFFYRPVDQAYPVISFPSDRLTIDKVFTQAPTSLWSFTSMDPWFSPEQIFLFSLITFGISIGVVGLFGKARAKQEKSAQRRRHRVGRRRLHIASEMARIRVGKLKNSFFHSNQFPPS